MVTIRKGFVWGIIILLILSFAIPAFGEGEAAKAEKPAHYGFLSLLPPVLAIGLAMITKEVLSSLVIGIAAGALTLTGGNIIEAFKKAMELLINTAGDPSWNFRVLLFTVLLGAIIGMVSRANGPQAFGRWAEKHIKSRSISLFITWCLGVLIFMDDYFNCMTVGTALRPVTDRFKVSRAKLSFIIDSTAAPVCTLVPVSTWVAYVASLMVPLFEQYKLNLNPYTVYVQMIPYDFYPWLIVLMVLVTSFTNLEYGPMAVSERRALSGKGLWDTNIMKNPPGDEFASLEKSEKGSAIDMVGPLLGLIVIMLFAMAYSGGFFEGKAGFFTAVMNSDSATSLVWGATITVILSAIFYSVRGVVRLKDSMEAVIQGAKSMMVALFILSLAWTIGKTCQELGTGVYVSSIMSETFPTWAVPVTVFLISAFIAFSTGTSWGTWAIMIPIVIPLVVAMKIDILPCIAAVLSGGVFGDHCSPISDTTIMSSTGGACPHIEHVNTQLPYALTAAITSAVGFLMLGFFDHPFVVWFITIALFFVVVYIMHKVWTGESPVKPQKALPADQEK
ncbi:MAG: tetracycline resistance efflux pump [Thermoanaerobacteraceae bacterium]|uniref:Na+/H+ antiporter NhaC family protein n=1 Tax=Biomaibacter acetigenes TaxID=2316383 RepID=A0A3G2R374_9FIRM|nr:Na+/H+ antiporter NhaC family protein [Biomaibacter acetigenes]AYO29842.1 Na+/H+ antiporter NhaC family protein [Biomaibacter acetigenes]MDK2877975.1 tetracycline resistance efflux pump [Thermoanaerobacteraceae bacterium]MDN5311305.1 tetracycline resistance efflux pump [Thermoanaerobacteraceae bacterium]RKL64398.1 Na+/H+ antiporter NhaC family protein [Thermoanaerobacteraceae bacterium SP2]